MKPLYTISEFESVKSTDKLPCQCYYCNKPFYVMKKNIKYELNQKRERIKYCSTSCVNKSQQNKSTVICSNCSKEILKIPSIIKQSKSGNHFCCKSCAATYNNKHKKYGTRRSKLEKWLEEKLTKQYPNLEFHFNRKDTIDSELDIYIPSMKLAFELNGIFHYEPIYGKNKLNQIQKNDNNKFQQCQKHSISLCTIDTSGQKYFKEKTSKKYLNIITTIIIQRTMLNS